MPLKQQKKITHTIIFPHNPTANSVRHHLKWVFGQFRKNLTLWSPLWELWVEEYNSSCILLSQHIDSEILVFPLHLTSQIFFLITIDSGVLSIIYLLSFGMTESNVTCHYSNKLTFTPLHVNLRQQNQLHPWHINST